MQQTHFDANKDDICAMFGNHAFEKFDEYIKREKITFYDLKTDLVFNWISTLNDKIINRINFLLNTDSHFVYIGVCNFIIMYEYWVRKGKHFHIDNDLANMLVQTDVHKVKSSLIKLPFDSTYFTVPNDLVQIELTDDEGETAYTCYAEGAYVSEIKDENNNTFLRISMFNNVRNEKNPEKKEGQISVKLLLPINEREDVFNFLERHLDEMLPLPPTKDVNDYYMKLHYRIIAKRFILLIVNSLLYLQSDKAVLEHVNVNKNKIENKKHKKKRSKRSADNSYIRIGKKVTINPSYKKVYEKLNTLDSEDNNRNQYRGQWIVRGHWRNQPYGEGLSQRKLIWIEPYVKGIGELTETQYTIK
ncbi:hypothetical protein [Priestia megaterium]|uniref:hypothetical protein n=1 Tax=Priestia megaterium TaxID=1404 RepID=UPI0039DFCFF8